MSHDQEVGSNSLARPADPDLDPRWIQLVHDRLAAWYHPTHRDLPWREEHEPYRVLVAETMLVQTTVKTVQAFYGKFLRQFPTPQALADADEQTLLRAWEGLGYYRRARNLQAAARLIVTQHGGQIPSNENDLRQLPGVGPYIAGAILSFAFDKPAPILEANTQRVLARLLAWNQDILAAASQRRLWLAAGRLVPDQSPGRFNQALMDLGALVCTVSKPACLICPLADSCHARAAGLQDILPLKARPTPPTEVTEACALIDRHGRFLIIRRKPDTLWAGFWEFPTLHIEGPDPAARVQTPEAHTLANHLRTQNGLEVELLPVARTLRYVVTRYRVSLTVRHAHYKGGKIRPGPGHDLAAWVPPAALDQYPLASPYRRIARELLKRSP